MSVLEQNGVSAPTLSVTVTNYNYGRFLPQNIESILAQTFTDFELVLIDNASEDCSRDIMQKYAVMDRRVRVVEHEKNIGMLASLRESCDISRGRYRVHVDADDWVSSPTAFQEQIDVLENHPTMSLVYPALTLVDADGRELHVSHPYPRDVVLRSARALEGVLSFNLNHSGMMFRLDMYRASGGYPDAYPHVCDMMLAVRLCEQGELVGYLDRQLYAFRQHGSNIHLHPQLQVMKREVLPVVDAAYNGALGSDPDARQARPRVMRNAMVHLPTQYIFSGQPGIGWRLYWESVKVHPIATIFQRRTLSLVARTVLGRRGYERLVAPIVRRIEG